MLVGMLVGKLGRPVGRLSPGPGMLGKLGRSVGRLGRLTPGILGKLGRPVGRLGIPVGRLIPGILGRPVGRLGILKPGMLGRPVGRLGILKPGIVGRPGNPPSPGIPVGKPNPGRLNLGKLRPGGMREPKRVVRKIWKEVLWMYCE